MQLKNTNLFNLDNNKLIFRKIKYHNINNIIKLNNKIKKKKKKKKR